MRPTLLLSLVVLLLLQLSALREIALAKEIHDVGVDGHQYLYLGPPLASHRPLIVDADAFNRLLRSYLSKDEIQRGILPFIPPGSRTSHIPNFFLC